MALNTNPQAIRFANERARPMADLLATSYISAKKVLSEVAAHGIGTVIPNTADVIDDGAAVDGRPPASNAKVLALVTLCQELVNWFETSSLNGTGTGAMKNVGAVTALAVNGTSKF